jgi:hypothetical protein
VKKMGANACEYRWKGSSDFKLIGDLSGRDKNNNTGDINKDILNELMGEVLIPNLISKSILPVFVLSRLF